MGFEVVLAKPSDREHDGNRVWAEVFCKALPQFTELDVSIENRRFLALDLASDIGLTPDEYVEREIGLELDFERGDFWVRVEFWQTSATITLPNFPTIPIEAAVAEILPCIEFLVAVGFTLEDPTSGAPMPPGDREAELVKAYSERQAQVARVAELTGGTIA